MEVCIGSKLAYVTMTVIFANCAAVAQARVCAPPLYVGPATAALPSDRDVDQALLDDLVLQATNYERCQRGLRPLAAYRELRDVAEGHSAWMAETGVFAHESTKPGHHQLKDRVRAGGLRPRLAAENLANFPIYRLEMFPEGVRVLGPCRFASPDGEVLSRRSYASLVKEAMVGLMASPGHRANILNTKITHHAAALRLNTAGKGCGRAYITQNMSANIDPDHR